MQLSAEIPVIDVRSPGEFDSGHICGALNIPLFDDDQRAEIGTLYKQTGRQSAVLKGLEHAGAKLSQIVEQCLENVVENKILIHCWRGGMRSQSFAWAVEQAQIEAHVLEGGYKSYRRAAHEYFQQPIPFVVLTGLTGAGKTDLLHLLREQGEQVLDLEGLANHRGSAFGGIGQEKQPRVEQFENDLFTELRRMDPSRRIWVEDESKRIGKTIVPDPIHHQMQTSAAIRVNVSMEQRSIYLAQEYGNLPPADLEESVNKISKRLDGPKAQQAIRAIHSGDAQLCAEICLEYYDKTYLHSASRNGRHVTKDIAANKSGDPDIVPELIQLADELFSCEVAN